MYRSGFVFSRQIALRVCAAERRRFDFRSGLRERQRASAPTPTAAVACPPDGSLPPPRQHRPDFSRAHRAGHLSAGARAWHVGPLPFRSVLQHLAAGVGGARDPHRSAVALRSEHLLPGARHAGVLRCDAAPRHRAGAAVLGRHQSGSALQPGVARGVRAVRICGFSARQGADGQRHRIDRRRCRLRLCTLSVLPLHASRAPDGVLDSARAPGRPSHRRERPGRATA